ncbi:MAG: DUF2267 domain-containing protein [Deltaproteobacteria bacterium]|nr:DUF2267 domain-containing protein [Deltaproteobacteria bacterium]
MPVPAEYQRATEDFYSFLEEVRDVSDLGTTHRAYTTIQGVFQTFRRRLDLKGAIVFAGVLPAGLRALFVADWNPDEPKLPFGDISDMTKEVQALRADHNFATESAIGDVASVIRSHVDEAAFESVLLKLPQGAREFWQTT